MYVNTDDLDKVIDKLHKANSIINEINSELKKIYLNTDYKIRESSQKFEIEDCKDLEGKTKILKESIEEDILKFKSKSLEDISGYILPGLLIPKNNDSVYRFDGNFNLNDEMVANEESYKFKNEIELRDDIDQESKNYLIGQYDKGNKRACVLKLTIIELKKELDNETQKLTELKNKRGEIQSIISETSLEQQRSDAELLLSEAKLKLSSIEREIEDCIDIGLDPEDQRLYKQAEEFKENVKKYENYLNSLNDNKNLENNEKLSEEIKQQEELILSKKVQIYEYENELRKYEFDYVKDKRITKEYVTKSDINLAIKNSIIFDVAQVFENYNLYNLNEMLKFQLLSDLEHAKELDVLTILIYIYETKKEEFKETYPEEEFNKENILKHFGIIDIMNDERSLDARAFLYLNDAQLKDYIYIKNTEGNNRAQQYLLAFESEINQLLGWDMFVEDIDSISDVEGELLELLTTLGFGMDDGLIGWFNNVASAFNRNTTMTPTEYKAMYLSQMFLMANVYLEVDKDTLLEMKNSGQVSEDAYKELQSKEKVTKLDIDLANGTITKEMKIELENALENDEDLKKFVEKLKGNGTKFNYTYQIGSNIGNMVPAIAAGAVTGGAGWASNLALFIGAYGGSYKEAKRDGNEELSANIVSLLSAGSEVVTEYFLGEIEGLAKGTKFIDIADDVGVFATRWDIFKNFMKTGAKEIFREIKEEEIQNVLDAVFKGIFYGQPIELSGQEMIDTAIITFFTTGILDTPNNIANLVYQNVNYTRTVVFKLDNGQIVEVPIQNLVDFKNKDGIVDLERFKKYLIEENISKNIEQVVNSTEEQIDSRIETARNRIFETNKGLAFGKNNPASLHTNADHVYRNTGMAQIQDILECGYIRPREGKIAGGHENEVHWSRGSNNLYYIPNNNNYILETSSKVLQNDQIGAISINDLTAIWHFDESQNKYVNVLDDIKDIFIKKHNITDIRKVETLDKAKDIIENNQEQFEEGMEEGWRDKNATLQFPNSNDFEIINVSKLNTEKIDGKLSRGVDSNIMNMSYREFDVVYKSKENASTIINYIIKNRPAGNILIELDSTVGLTEETISQLPSNVKIRVLGDYGIENFKGFASNDSCLASLNKVTYSLEEMSLILKELKKFDAGINPNWTDMEKAKYAYDYLTNKLRYRSNNQDDCIGGNVSRPKHYDGLINLIIQKSTCQGFAHTYKELLTRMGISCIEISGRLGSIGQHAFNVVTIDGRSFIVDTTRNKFEDYYEDLVEHPERVAIMPSNLESEQQYRNLLKNKKDKYLGTGFDVSIENLSEYHFTSNKDLEVKVKHDAIDKLTTPLNIDTINQIMNNSNNVYFGHGTGVENQDIVNSIMQNGLRCSHGQMNATTYALNYGGSLSENNVNALNNWQHKKSKNIVIVSLPTNLLYMSSNYDQRQESFYYKSSDGTNYVMPEFILGYYDAETGLFHQNPNYYELQNAAVQQEILDKVKKNLASLIEEYSDIDSYREMCEALGVSFPFTNEEVSRYFNELDSHTQQQTNIVENGNSSQKELDLDTFFDDDTDWGENIQTMPVSSPIMPDTAIDNNIKVQVRSYLTSLGINAKNISDEDINFICGRFKISKEQLNSILGITTKTNNNQSLQNTTQTTSTTEIPK